MKRQTREERARPWLVFFQLGLAESDLVTVTKQVFVALALHDDPSPPLVLTFCGKGLADCDLLTCLLLAVLVFGIHVLFCMPPFRLD